MHKMTHALSRGTLARAGGVTVAAALLAAMAPTAAMADWGASDTTSLVSVNGSGAPLAGDTYLGGISLHGRYVLMSGMLRDRFAGQNKALPYDSPEYNEVALSSDGGYVAYPTGRHEDGQLWRRNMTNGTTVKVSIKPNGQPIGPYHEIYGYAVSANGRFVAFSDYDVYVRDVTSGKTQRVSIGPNGQSLFALAIAMSGDGRYVAMAADGGAYIRDRATNKTVLAVPGSTWNLAISLNGRFLAFTRDVGGSSRVFVWDRSTRKVTPVSVSQTGGAPNGPSGMFGISMSQDGTYIAFASDASNLVAGDTNGKADAFVRNRVTGKTVRVSVGNGGLQADQASDFAVISADGRHVAFQSRATNLSDNPTQSSRVYVRDMYGDA